MYATYIRNRIPYGQQKETPYQILFKTKPDISHIRIFGSKTYVHIPDVKRKKLDPKCLEGILVGFCDLTKGYRVFIPVNRKVVVSLDVIIDETIIGLDTIVKDGATHISHQCPDPFTLLLNLVENRNEVNHPNRQKIQDFPEQIPTQPIPLVEDFIPHPIQLIHQVEDIIPNPFHGFDINNLNQENHWQHMNEEMDAAFQNLNQQINNPHPQPNELHPALIPDQVEARRSDRTPLYSNKYIQCTP